MAEVLLAMVKKTLDQHILLNLKTIVIISINFDLWMFCGSVDTFVLVIIFLNEVWALMHVVVGLLEVHGTSK